MKKTRAFTLIELLVVIAIILVLAALLVGAVGAYQKRAQLTQAVTRLKDLAAGFTNYTATHDGEFPDRGLPEPVWGGNQDDAANRAWYNAVPKAAGGRALMEYIEPGDFYDKKNPLIIPGATYPANKLSQPYFAVAINDLLYPDEAPGEGEPVATRVQNMVLPAKTVLFFESGLPGEKSLRGQAAYRARASGNTAQLVSRYTDNKDGKIEEATMNIVFGDGHVESLPGIAVMDENADPHSPQLEQYGGRGKVSWTLDPEASAKR